MREPVVAPEGYVLTDGKTVYGSIIYPTEGQSSDDFYPISEQEFKEKYPWLV